MRARLLEQTAHAIRRHQERVATRDDYLPHLGVRPDVREGVGEGVHRARAAALADHARARTEAAVDAAAIGREQKRAIGVSLHQVGRDLVGLFPEGIAQVARYRLRFVRDGDALAADGAVGIRSVDQRQVVGRDGERKAFPQRP